jgi:FlaA1/EpsC-like NDP-sugar epimerase
MRSSSRPGPTSSSTRRRSSTSRCSNSTRCEAWKTNVLGTLNVLRAARPRWSVATFVNVSTDKAAQPDVRAGLVSKRITERLTASFAVQRAQGRYVSRAIRQRARARAGRSCTAFTAQIEQGGPVTVTHPDVERYFMLIPEACQLVLQSAAIGRDGEVMVLEMGNPVKIVEVAKHPHQTCRAAEMSRSPTPGCGRARRCPRSSSPPASRSVRTDHDLSSAA